MQLRFLRSGESNRELDKIVYEINNVIKVRRNYIEATKQLPENIELFFDRINQAITSPTVNCFNSLNDIINSEEEILKAEISLKENLNDILERNKAIINLEKDFNNKKLQLEDVKNEFCKYQSLVRNKTDNTPLSEHTKNLEKFDKCKKLFQKSINDTRRMLEGLIDNKKKFCNFILSRFKKGFLDYKSALERSYTVEMGISKEISSNLQEVIKSLDKFAAISQNQTSEQIASSRTAGTYGSSHSTIPRNDALQSNIDMKNPFDDD